MKDCILYGCVVTSKGGSEGYGHPTENLGDLDTILNSMKMMWLKALRYHFKLS